MDTGLARCVKNLYASTCIIDEQTELKLGNSFWRLRPSCAASWPAAGSAGPETSRIVLWATVVGTDRNAKGCSASANVGPCRARRGVMSQALALAVRIVSKLHGQSVWSRS